MATGSGLEAKSDVTPQRPQKADVKTEVLPSVLKLHKCEKISKLK